MFDPTLSVEERIYVNSEIQKRKHSIGISYFYLLLFGLFGGHRFYFGKKKTAIAILILTIFPIILRLIVINGMIPFNSYILYNILDLLHLTIFVSIIWVVVDAILIPTWSRRETEAIERQVIEQLNTEKMKLQNG